LGSPSTISALTVTVRLVRFEMTYAEMLDQIKALEAWLIAVAQDPYNTRLSKYKHDISILADPAKLANLRSHFSEPELRGLFFTFTEIHELSTIFSTLNAQHEHVLKDRFLEAITGPASSVMEKPSNSSNRPRNLQFELLLMAHLAGAGFPIVDTRLSDIQTSFMDRTIIIECKRPQREKSIHAAIKDGVQQLQRRHSGNQLKSIPVLALSLTKVITEGHIMLRAPDARSALEALSGAIHQIIEPHVPYFHAQARNSVAGILVHATACIIRQNTHSPATVAMQVFFDNPQMNAEDYKMAEKWFQEYEKLEKLD
jgi:hypothetical protein